MAGPSDAERIARVQQGSRRKRDLVAAGGDLTAPQQAEARSKARRDTAWRWAADNLPDRETALAAGAYLMLTRHGSKTTPQAVAARLDRTYGERSFKRFYEEGS